MEVVRFTPEEIDEAIEGMDGLQEIIVPLLRKINLEGMAEQDIQQFKKHIKACRLGQGQEKRLCESGRKMRDLRKSVKQA